MIGEQYNELAYYTLSQDVKYFIHQHVVDAYTAQYATKSTKKIALFFALAGLYLTVEKGYSGKQVQLAHLKMANDKEMIPSLHPINIEQTNKIETILLFAPGAERDKKIIEWCHWVWDKYTVHHDQVRQHTNLMLDK